MDDYVRDVLNGLAGKRDAVSLQSYRWPERTIYYEFGPNICKCEEFRLQT